MDYELIFWVASFAVAALAVGPLVARANRESYVDWVEKEEIVW